MSASVCHNKNLLSQIIHNLWGRDTMAEFPEVVTRKQITVLVIGQVTEISKRFVCLKQESSVPLQRLG